MTTKEYLLDKAWREGFEEGYAEGLEEERKLIFQKEIIEHLILNLDFPDFKIMEIISCSEEFLAEIRSQLGKAHS